MSYDENDYAFALWAQEQGEQEMIEDALESISTEAARSYLAQYGDAVQKRVDSCIDQAESLRAEGFPSQAAFTAVVAVELVFRFILLRPLVQGAFLSEEWAEILTRRVASGRTSRDREILPGVLRNWGVEVDQLLLPGGGNLWESLVGPVWTTRDVFVHKGAPIGDAEAGLAIECVREIQTQVVHPVARRLKLAPLDYPSR